ncbi:MAG: hypothetical protein ABI833_12970 [Acidobacteriota bacterium]
MRTALLITAAWTASFVASVPANAADGSLDYRVLATSKTSTMERELNEAAAAGYRFSKAMGGKSANGGQEVIVAMVKDPVSSGQTARKYRLLASTKTSTMQREIQQASDQGYAYREQTVFESAFGGREVVVIMELDPSKKAPSSSYRLLATNKTSTMQKELQDAGLQGYELLGLSIGKTEVGGDEVIAILRREE